jgi:hypothetical protein
MRHRRSRPELWMGYSELTLEQQTQTGVGGQQAASHVLKLVQVREFVGDVRE